MINDISKLSLITVMTDTVSNKERVKIMAEKEGANLSEQEKEALKTIEVHLNKTGHIIGKLLFKDMWDTVNETSPGYRFD